MKGSVVNLARSAWKGPHIVPLPISKALKEKVPIRTNARSCTILPQFVGILFQVHNGKEYVSFKVTEDMVGFKLGEFAPTRKRFKFSGSGN
ncbi:mitochondrial 37S ribosomal protein [Saccharomycopsis crataegensis]|uniref:Mitochondrial 37S ribosomal protein n=1 Tax=Saccharomycopsis crataegensis TaxID=43959 RepID=A0AAV5QE86_9ASCO|nr:mitochondrial 37S ribosomal protein [Saccharomycopsis crataegensis]